MAIPDAEMARIPAAETAELPRIMRAADSAVAASDIGANNSNQKISGHCLLLADMTAFLLAFIVGGTAARAVEPHVMAGLFMAYATREFFVFCGLGVLALLWLDTRGHYRQRLPYWEAVGNILSICLIGLVSCGFMQFAFHNVNSRLWLILNWLFLGLFLFAGRALVQRMLEKTGKWKINSVIIGTGATAESAIHALAREKNMGYEIVEQLSPGNLVEMSKPGKWQALLAACDASHMFLALEGTDVEKYNAALKQLVRERLPISIIPPWLGLPAGTISPHYFLMHDVVMLHDTNRLNQPLPRFLKRGFDILVSAGILLLLSPLFLLMALLVRKDGGPVFFSQPRVGRNGKEFSCYKFRSMQVNAEAYLEQYLKANPEAAEEWKKYQKLKKDVRITRVGHFMRKTSIDELPQLLNVLKGDMSLVGPRPIMIDQAHLYGDDFVYYESVRPGITGPWQVSGRNRLTFSERIVLESCYARNWSLWMDIVILLKTPKALLAQEQAF